MIAIITLVAVALILLLAVFTVLAGTARDRQDYLTAIEHHRANARYWRLQAGKDQSSLIAAAQLIEQLEEEISHLKAGNLDVARKYVKATNELAWERQLNPPKGA